MNRIGLEYLTLLGTHPLDFIRAAANANCAHVAFFLANSPYDPPGSAIYSIIDDAKLRADIAKSLDDNGLSIGLFDGFALYKDQPPDIHRPAFDAIAELGVKRVNTISFDDDWERTLNETPKIVEMAGEYGITVTVESCPLLPIATLQQALDLITQAALPNFKLLIDTMHIVRSKEIALLSTLDPMLIDYVQISDGPLQAKNLEAYMDEAMYERQIPGEGEMPLIELLRMIRSDVIVSCEVPLRSKREAGISNGDCARLVCDGARRILDFAFTATSVGC